MACSIGESVKNSPSLAVRISHVTVLREEQPEKHSSPKLVTEDGMSMDVREEQK